MYNKKRFLKRRYGFLIIYISIIICISACSFNESPADTDEKTKNPAADLSESEDDINDLSNAADENIWFLVGAEIKKLDNVPGIDEPAIIVNGHNITKKEIEIQKIYSEYIQNETLKDAVNSMIRMAAVQSEAIRLDVKPQKEKVETYLKQTNDSLNKKINGTETIFYYMQGLGISQEEYIDMLEETAYDMFQREALWNMVQPLNKEKTYDQYIDEIVERAKIKIIDPEIEAILNEDN